MIRLLIRPSRIRKIQRPPGHGRVHPFDPELFRECRPPSPLLLTPETVMQKHCPINETMVGFVMNVNTVNQDMAQIVKTEVIDENETIGAGKRRTLDAAKESDIRVTRVTGIERIRHGIFKACLY